MDTPFLVALSTGFLASAVEIAEAFTIVLAVAALNGLRPAIAGVVAAIAVLTLLVVLLGPLINSLPFHEIQLVIGVLLLLFGLGWMRQAISKYAGDLPMPDEDKRFQRKREALAAEEQGVASARARAWIGGITSFKAVLLEGLEVAFIVIAIGARPGALAPAALGAGLACVTVLVAGAIFWRPLRRVPETALKYTVGAMTCAFGVFWTAEAFGYEWPMDDLDLLRLAALFAGLGAVTVLARRTLAGAAR